ncbi:hypothetical protein DJICPGNB_26025 [Escherichia coli]|nr:hypothetical protein DJICPGNB_26025 [Escherichia coli]
MAAFLIWRGHAVGVNYRKEDYIDDLRVLLHFFAHKEFITINHALLRCYQLRIGLTTARPVTG